MTKTNRRYQIPASTGLALKDGLSAKLKELWTVTQGSSFDLFLYAAGLRERYLDKKKDQYSPEFQEWYAKQELHRGADSIIYAARSSDLHALSPRSLLTSHGALTDYVSGRESSRATITM